MIYFHNESYYISTYNKLTMAKKKGAPYYLYAGIRRMWGKDNIPVDCNSYVCEVKGENRRFNPSWFQTDALPMGNYLFTAEFRIDSFWCDGGYGIRQFRDDVILIRKNFDKYEIDFLRGNRSVYPGVDKNNIDCRKYENCKDKAPLKDTAYIKTKRFLKYDLPIVRASASCYDNYWCINPKGIQHHIFIEQKQPNGSYARKSGPWLYGAYPNEFGRVDWGANGQYIKDGFTFDSKYFRYVYFPLKNSSLELGTYRLGVHSNLRRVNGGYYNKGGWHDHWYYSPWMDFEVVNPITYDGYTMDFMEITNANTFNTAFNDLKNRDWKNRWCRNFDTCAKKPGTHLAGSRWVDNIDISPNDELVVRTNAYCERFCIGADCAHSSGENICIEPSNIVYDIFLDKKDANGVYRPVDSKWLKEGYPNNTNFGNNSAMGKFRYQYFRLNKLPVGEYRVKTRSRVLRTQYDKYTIPEVTSPEIVRDFIVSERSKFSNFRPVWMNGNNIATMHFGDATDKMPLRHNHQAIYYAFDYNDFPADKKKGLKTIFYFRLDGKWQNSSNDFIYAVYMINPGGGVTKLKREVNAGGGIGFRYDPISIKNTYRFLVEVNELKAGEHKILPQIVKIPKDEKDGFKIFGFGASIFQRAYEYNGTEFTQPVRPDIMNLEITSGKGHPANELKTLTFACDDTDCSSVNDRNIGYASFEIADANNEATKYKVYADNGTALLDGKSTASVKLTDGLANVSFPVITKARLRMFDTSYMGKTCKAFDENVDEKTANTIDTNTGEIYCQMPYAFAQLKGKRLLSSSDCLTCLDYWFRNKNYELRYVKYFNEFETGIENIIPYAGTMKSSDPSDGIKNANPLKFSFAYKSGNNAYWNVKNTNDYYLYKAKVYFKKDGNAIDKDDDGNYLGKFIQVNSPNFIKVDNSYCNYTPNYNMDKDGAVNIGGCFKYDYQTAKTMEFVKDISENLGKTSQFYLNLKEIPFLTLNGTSPNSEKIKKLHKYVWEARTRKSTIIPYDERTYKYLDRGIRYKIKNIENTVDIADPKASTWYLKNCPDCIEINAPTFIKLSNLDRLKLGETYSNITLEFAYPKVSHKNSFMKLKDFTMQLSDFELMSKGVYDLQKTFPFSQTGVYFKDANCYEKGGDVYKCKLMDLDKSNVYYYKNGKLEAINKPCSYTLYDKNACYDKDYYRAKLEKLDNYSTTYLDGKVVRYGDSLYYETTNNYEFIKDVIYFKDLDANGKPLDKDLDSHVYSPEYYFSVIFKRHCEHSTCLEVK